MKLKGINLIILLAFFASSCDNSQYGIAHQALEDIYPYTAYERTMYPESMIRSATTLFELDAASDLTRHIRYALQYEVDTTSKWRYKQGTDSIVQYEIKAQGMETYTSYASKELSLSLYLLTEDEIITDIVLIKQDSSNYQLFELVGEIPIEEVFKAGLENSESLLNLMNTDLLNNGTADTTDQ